MVCEYLPGGLTNNYWKLIRNNPKSFLDFYGQRTELCKLFVPRIIAGIMYNTVYALIDDKGISKKKNFVIRLTTIPGKVLKQNVKGAK